MKSWRGDAGSIGGWLIANLAGLGPVGSILGRRVAEMRLKDIAAMETYIEDLATKKLNEDLDLSACHNPEVAANARHESQSRIRAAEPYTKLNLTDQIFSDDSIVKRIAKETAASSFHQTSDKLYSKLEPLRNNFDTILVNCECIELAPLVTLTILADRYALPIRIFSEDHSGRQQVVRVSSAPDAHFLVTANAAFNFGGRDSAKHYGLVMEVHWEFQELLVWKRENRKPGLVYVYDSSSATEQYEIYKEYLESKNKKLSLYGSIGSLVEELDYSRFMPGDFVIAWEPLSTGLINRSRKRLRRVKRSRYRHLISLYAREDISNSENNELDGFLEAFRHVWNTCRSDRDSARGKLLQNGIVMAQMAVGAGLGDPSA